MAFLKLKVVLLQWSGEESRPMRNVSGNDDQE
jgi:hypothetical protein